MYGRPRLVLENKAKMGKSFPQVGKKQLSELSCRSYKIISKYQTGY